VDTGLTKDCEGYYLLVDSPPKLMGIWNVVEFDLELVEMIEEVDTIEDKQRIIREYCESGGVFYPHAAIVLHRMRGKNVLMQRVYCYN